MSKKNISPRPYSSNIIFTQVYKNKRALWYPAAKTKGTKGVILFLPGFPKYPGYSEFISFFKGENYNTLVPMYSGTFDSAGKFSVESAVADVKIWYDFLKKNIIHYGPDKIQIIKKQNIILFSLSFGGLIAGLALKKFSFSKIKKCIFVSPLWDMASYKNNKSSIHIANETSKIVSFAYPFSYRFENKQRFFSQIKGSIAYPDMNKPFIDSNKMYLMFCGKTDKVTPVAMTKSLAKMHKKNKLFIVEGGHASKIELGKIISIIKKNI